MNDDRARRRVAQLGDAAAAAVPRARPARPRFREVPHDEVLDAASGTTGALVIGDAGFAAADALPARVDLGAAWRELTGLPFVYAVLGRPPGRGRRPTTSRCCSESLAARPGGARRRSRAPGREAHGGDPADYERYLTRQHPLPRWAPRSCPGWRRSSIARAAPSCCRAPARPRLFEARARIAPRADRRRVAIDRRAAGRRGRRRAPVARRRAAPVRRRAGARAGRRRRRAPPGAAPRRRGHLHHRSQRQLHERLRHPLQVLQLLPAAHQQDRGLRAVARGARRRSSRRPSTWAACRSCCRAASTPSCRSAGTRICSAG